MSDKTPKTPARPFLFEYNLPVQISRNGETGEIESILNYMPRRSRCTELQLSELLDEDTCSVEEMCEWTAKHFENLALLFREFAAKKRNTVYYHDEDFSTYAERLKAYNKSIAAVDASAKPKAKIQRIRRTKAPAPVTTPAVDDNCIEPK